MKNINYQIEKSSFLINQSLQNLPIGIAYLLLKNKIREIEQLYYQQIQLQEKQLLKQQEQQEQQEQQ